MWLKIPRFFRSFYFLFSVFFIVWMFCFDSNDFMTQYQMTKKLNDLEDEKEHFTQKIAEVQKDREELLSNSALLEKYAREKYQMKRPTEDLFIIMKKEDKQN